MKNFVWQTGETIDRNKEHWFNFEITHINKLYLTFKITSWPEKWKYSFLEKELVDEYLIFNWKKWKQNNT